MSSTSVSWTGLQVSRFPRTSQRRLRLGVRQLLSNESVQRAFEQLTGRRICVPPNHDVTGAIGAALLAMDGLRARSAGTFAPETNFKGFAAADQEYESALFECQACPNVCEISKVTITGRPPIFYGARCDRFEEAGRRTQSNDRASGIPDLFAERERLLLGDYEPRDGSPRRPRLGLPRALLFHELFPYWRKLFDSLGIDVVLSSATNPRIISQTAEYAAVEACFPAKLMFGHVLDLIDRDLDFIFLPSVANRENSAPGQLECNYCTFIPAMPHLVKAHVEFRTGSARPIALPFHMQWPRVMRRELRQLANTLGVSAHRMLPPTSWLAPLRISSTHRWCSADEKSLTRLLRTRSRPSLSAGPTTRATQRCARTCRPSSGGWVSCRFPWTFCPSMELQCLNTRPTCSGEVVRRSWPRPALSVTIRGSTPST